MHRMATGGGGVPYTRPCREPYEIEGNPVLESAAYRIHSSRAELSMNSENLVLCVNNSFIKNSSSCTETDFLFLSREVSSMLASGILIDNFS